MALESWVNNETLLTLQGYNQQSYTNLWVDNAKPIIQDY